MSKITRFGVSLEDELLTAFDAWRGRRRSPSRSEAIRDLIRAALVAEATGQDDAPAVATLSLVYNHHASDLSQRLTELQHAVHSLIITTLHIHLDHDNCLEVLVLKGKAQEIRGLAERILAVKGVKHGQLALSSTAELARAGKGCGNPAGC